MQTKKIQGNSCFFEQIFYRKQSLGVPALRQFQVTIYVETHCKRRRKKVYLRGAIAIDRKVIPCKVRLDPLYTDRAEQVCQTTIFRIPGNF